MLLNIFIAVAALCFALVLALWTNACFYRRPSVKPSDYPWLKRARQETPEQWADELISRMSLEEKIAQLSGDGGWKTMARLAFNFVILKRLPNMYAGFNTRLKIPPLSFSDGPRGIVVASSTAFPVAMARGATWDTTLERRVADVFGREARAAGANYFGGVCVNLLSYPQWGRAQETWGEDPFHVGEMGAASVAGVQHHNVMACVKHFAVNNIENSRFYVDVKIDARSLHEVYLPHFRRCVDAGAASIMTAYNKVNGDFCSHQHWLLEDILRQQWGFKGFITSDWGWGVHDTVKGIQAGMDVEMPITHIYSEAKIKQALAENKLSEAHIDTLVRRILATRLRFASRTDPEIYDRTLIACDQHQALSQEVAEKSMVLLQNNNACLPFNGVNRLAVIGELAVEPNIGDNGSSRIKQPHIVTILKGLQEWLGDAQIVYHDGKDTQVAAAIAASCEAALVVAGCWPNSEGENVVSNHTPPETIPEKRRGGDRDSMALAADQRALIQAVGRAQTRTAVTLIGGSALFTDDWSNDVAAIVMAWYPGMLGGRALARLLSGELNFSGRLPFAWPSSKNKLPLFDAYAPQAEYSYYHGYTWFDHSQQQPAYPMGFGLNYGQPVIYENVKKIQSTNELRINVTLKNPDARTRREVVQCYVGAPDQIAVRHRKNLKAFDVIELAGNAQREIELTIPLNRLRRYCDETQQWLLDAGEYRVWVGPSSDESKCLQATAQLAWSPTLPCR